ncbi:unnamed protein product [Adineta steineri]|uniref:Uncharacterized protein n=1 Tax=Adineta steineri TaxID=433720 RepID=A0A815N640_9BILA|nr:unnamed protein product [Adineta steineri]CAF1427672.1 unnamed protein product [Adineta steineri]
MFFFHFCQSIYIHVQSLSLISNYFNNLMIRNVIEQAMALALVPALYVQELNDDEREDISELLHYFNDH